INTIGTVIADEIYKYFFIYISPIIYIVLRLKNFYALNRTSNIIPHSDKKVKSKKNIYKWENFFSQTISRLDI
ncbi:MAG: hypothetical protein J6J52_06255, partial [Oscillospiraceae bacterium]|nr:hypothetical protein [Oscillospiraceae bacterium]